jgi:hypothetical protein
LAEFLSGIACLFLKHSKNDSLFNIGTLGKHLRGQLPDVRVTKVPLQLKVVAAQVLEHDVAIKESIEKDQIVIGKPSHVCAVGTILHRARSVG